MASWTTISKAPLRKLLPRPIRHLVRRCVPAPAGQSAKLYPFHGLLKSKCDLIDHAIHQVGIRSFADLGGVWNVDGGYSFYALESGKLHDGCLVDFSFTPAFTSWRSRYPQLRTIQGNFGAPEAAEKVGKVDAVFLFDVLLHQVNPSWDEVLALYARRVDCFVILNQQFHARTTFRLLSRGRDEYFQHVPHTTVEVREYQMAFERPNDIHPDLGCRHYDNPAIWQWGITDDDLIGTMKRLGFALQYYKQCEPWSMPHVRNHAFVFCRATTPHF